MAPFLTNARFAETGDNVVGLDAGLAAPDGVDGDGAARGDPLGASTTITSAAAIASPTPRRDNRHRALPKDAPNIKGYTDSAPGRHRGETLSLSARGFDHRTGSPTRTVTANRAVTRGATSSDSTRTPSRSKRMTIWH